MALPNEVNVGTAPNNGTGDPLRTGGQKINANFQYLEDNKQDISEKGAANGYVGLNANVKIGNEYIQMPVIPVETVPATGEENVLYVESSTSNLKVWNGTAYNNYSGTGGGGGDVTYQAVVDALGFVPANDADLDDAIVRISDNEDDIVDHELRITELENNPVPSGERTRKPVTNTTQYTVVASDFTDSELHFTGVPSNETIDVIINIGVCPNTDPSTGLQIVVHPDSKISFSGTAYITPQPGATLTSANDGSSVAIIGVKPIDNVNNFGLFGSLEGDGTGGGSGEMNVQSDWNETDTESDAFILNKPTSLGETPLVTNSEQGSVKPPNLTDSGVASYALLSPANGAEFTAGDDITLIIDVDESGGTDGTRYVPVAYRENGETVFDWEEKEASASIDNITEIPNRSYNDLQDLPNRTIKTYNDTATYSSVLEDNDRFVQVGDTVTDVEIPTGVFSDGDVLVFQAGGNGNPLFSEGDGVSTSVLFLPEGMTYKVKSAGTVYVRMISANSGVLTGDLVKEYDITASPDGTLWKTGQVDNSGNPVAPTAL